MKELKENRESQGKASGREEKRKRLELWKPVKQSRDLESDFVSVLSSFLRLLFFFPFFLLGKGGGCGLWRRERNKKGVERSDRQEGC